MIKPLVLLGLLGLLSLSAQADDCVSCRERKSSLCVMECAAVPYDQQRVCRNGCINEYCSHRCETPQAFKEYENCESCSLKELPFCTPLCTTGTVEQRIACERECVQLRCASLCETEATTEAEKPAESEKH